MTTTGDSIGLGAPCAHGSGSGPYSVSLGAIVIERSILCSSHGTRPRPIHATLLSRAIRALSQISGCPTEVAVSGCDRTAITSRIVLGLHGWLAYRRRRYRRRRRLRINLGGGAAHCLCCGRLTWVLMLRIGKSWFRRLRRLHWDLSGVILWYLRTQRGRRG